MSSRPLGVSLALISITLVSGLAVRFAPLGLPPFVVKFGGSTLWALMLYWMVSTLLPSWRIPTVSMLTGVLTASVEFFKLYHSPALETFRRTLPGILLLGRIFSAWDILAYLLAISVGASLDMRVRPIDWPIGE
jgi:hypothetical protein